MISFKGKNVKEEKYLSAILDLLTRYHKSKASYEKPYVSRTFAVKIEGQDEATFERDFLTYASQVGWLIEQH